MLLSLLLLACKDEDAKVTSSPSVVASKSAGIAPPEAPAAQPSVDIGDPRAPAAWRAIEHLAEASIVLPERPALENADGRFPLLETWGDAGALGSFRVWTHPLPFQTDMPRPNYAPYNAKLVATGRTLPFIGASDDRQTLRESWYIDRNRIKLISASDPEQWAEPGSMEVPELAALQKRRHPQASGMSPADYVSTSWTREGLTRRAILLPAPASIAWTLDVPAGGRLRLSPGLLPDPIQGVAKGDGATIRVEVGGEEVWKGTVEPTSALADATIDLAKWAGQKVEVKLLTEPGATETGDDVVLAEVDLVGTPPRPPRRIVVVGMDTTRWDALSINGYARPTSPALDAWGRQSVRFDNAWAPAPRTRPSFRTAMTGQYPLDAVHAPTIAELLRPLGFSTAGVVANIHLVPRFGFSDGFDFWHYENGARGDVETDRALAWLDAHPDEDAFLFVHYMDPHTFYDAPDGYKGTWAKRRPEEVPPKFNRWQIYELMNTLKLTPEGKAWIRGAYDEEILFMQEQIARLLSAVTKMPGDTLVIVHSDHGEEFWEHDGYEHNHSLHSELVKTVLWVRPPGGWGGGDHVVDTQVGLVDLVPTILDFAGLPKERWPSLPGHSLRPFVDAGRSAEVDARKAELDARPLVIGHMMFGQERWGVIHDRKAYQLQTNNGREWLHDLTVDPGQTKNLAIKGDETVLEGMRRALEKGSGWPLRWGWRVRVPGSQDPIVVELDAPVEAAGIMDPEAKRHVRANLEWGEAPEKTVADVGTVSLSADKKTLRYEPGPKPQDGALWVQCAVSPCPGGKVSVGERSGTIAGEVVKDRSLRVSFEPGWIFVPLVTEAEAIATPASGEMEALEALGYVGGD